MAMWISPIAMPANIMFTASFTVLGMGGLAGIGAP
jgi:hypothetical protein